MIGKLGFHWNIAKDLLRWQFRYLKKGIPVERFQDEEYIKWHNKYSANLLSFKKIHEGEDCFIIGNGPSLNKMDLTKLNSHYTFGLNKIYLMFNQQQLDLSYLVAVNPLVIEQSLEIYKNNFDIPLFLNDLAIKHEKNLPKHILPIKTKAKWSFYDDLSKPIAEGYTVTFVAMQIAYFMGFKRVFLVGVDHNFKQKGKPNQEQLYKGDDINHFHPDYFKGQKWHLADIEANEASYALAKHQFRMADKKIFDATIEGKLTVFPKITYDEALKMAKQK